jgi:hypothetical protein
VVEKLIDTAGENRWGHRDATAILVAYRHGLRASEVDRVICSAKKACPLYPPNSDHESGFPRQAMSALPPKQTCAVQLGMSALGQ